MAVSKFLKLLTLDCTQCILFLVYLSDKDDFSAYDQNLDVHKSFTRTSHDMYTYFLLCLSQRYFIEKVYG